MNTIPLVALSILVAFAASPTSAGPVDDLLKLADGEASASASCGLSSVSASASGDVSAHTTASMTVTTGSGGSSGGGSSNSWASGSGGGRATAKAEASDGSTAYQFCDSSVLAIIDIVGDVHIGIYKQVNLGCSGVGDRTLNGALAAVDGVPWIVSPDFSAPLVTFTADAVGSDLPADATGLGLRVEYAFTPDGCSAVLSQ